MCFIKSFFESRSGASAIEYGLITALLGIASVAAISSTGSSLSQSLECISKSLASELCVGGQQEAQTTSSQGWGGDFAVIAGETYEISFPEDMQFTVWDNGHIWYDPDEGYEYMDFLGIGAVITDTPFSTLDTKYITSDRYGHKTDAQGQSDFDNIAFFEDGKLQITAQDDGYLSIGIHDWNAHDNWVSYDGGATKTRDINYTITRIE